MADTAKLIVDGTTYELPIIEGTEGERAIDIGNLRAQTGYVTMDPGYANTGSCQSAITFIDGEKGILRYRGYPIEQLAEKSTFLETAFLIFNGELPSRAELAEFEDEITHHTLIHEDIRHIYSAFPLKAHPMAIVSAIVSSISTFYQKDLDPLNTEAVRKQAYR
ncbi:MAG: citrate (Si)-synthase, partial [Gemmatimonadetes bacterium]|nr:citrate (Si)-synthase [Gemmatimonadota bacterium]